MARTSRLSVHEQRERRRLQNRLAQQRYRKRRKNEPKESTAPSAQDHSETTEVASPALDMKVLASPSARFRLEILHGQLEKKIRDYAQLMAENMDDPSVTHFVDDNWPSLLKTFESGFARCLSRGQHENTQRQQPSNHLSPKPQRTQTANSPDPAISMALSNLSNLEKQVRRMRVPEQNGYVACHDTSGQDSASMHLITIST